MLFNFTTWNHCPQGRIIVEDITVPMGHQIMALGHDVTWTTDPEFALGHGSINVVLESFADDPATLRDMSAAHASGAQFLIVATEEPTPTGFNCGLEPAMIQRQDAFPAAAKLACGILHLIPGTHVNDWYRQFAPAAHAEIGYAPSLIDDREAIGEPMFDFGFYGKMTWRRDQIINRLTADGASVLVMDTLDVPRAERNEEMRRAKVILQIRANEEWGMVSSTRCASALSMGRPIVAEPHPLSKPWDQVVDFSDSLDSFLHDALQARHYWRDLHAIQLKQFRAVMTPEVCVGAPLRAIGVLPRDFGEG